LVVLVTAGQANDSPILSALLDGLRVPRLGPGRPRTRPDAVLGDKAYSARAHRERLRAAGLRVCIPEPSDQVRNRAARGSDGGRPPSFDETRYRDRNVVERAFADLKQWRGIATRYELNVIYRSAVMLHTVIRWARSFRDTP
jgi:transposase